MHVFFDLSQDILSFIIIEEFWAKLICDFTFWRWIRARRDQMCLHQNLHLLPRKLRLLLLKKLVSYPNFFFIYIYVYTSACYISVLLMNAFWMEVLLGITKHTFYFRYILHALVKFVNAYSYCLWLMHSSYLTSRCTLIIFW